MHICHHIEYVYKYYHSFCIILLLYEYLNRRETLTLNPNVKCLCDAGYVIDKFHIYCQSTLLSKERINRMPIKRVFSSRICHFIFDFQIVFNRNAS